MFGDAGHGCLMLGLGLYMCIKEKMLEARKIDNEIWKYFFNGRYLITIMAMFSIYTGLIYNDIFSKSLNIFGSSWSVDMHDDDILKVKNAMIDPRGKAEWYGTPYPFGVDPIWQVSENKIVFLNAFKMKMSIILGVIHMSFGVAISYWNATYFKRPLNIFAEVIPQIIFLTCMFGYLTILMWMKWTMYSADAEDFINSERCAPSILITFINMALFKTNEYEPACETGYMYAGQKHIQRLLLIVALSMVPILLFVKPFIQMREHNQKASARRHNVNGGGGEAGADQGEEAFDTSEVFILQAIHTIEYVLGSVSHTASYLRLWALSLAHAQLSDVLWFMVLRVGLRIDSWYGGVVLWIIFSAWACLTVSILCLMEGLSAVLHTLRLHWVEFNSKFYKGDGYLFIPFSFETILKEAEGSPDSK